GHGQTWDSLKLARNQTSPNPTAALSPAPSPTMFFPTIQSRFYPRTGHPRTTRTFVYAGITALVVTVLSDMIFPIPADRFFLMPAQIYCPAVILLAVAATYFDQRDTNLTAIVALTLIGAMLAGNTIAGFTYKPRLAFINRLLVHFHVFYGTVITVQLLAMLAVLARTDRRLPGVLTQPIRRSRRIMLLTVSIAAVFGGTLFLRKAAFYYENLMHQTFGELLRKYMMRRARSVVFGSDVNLWRTVPLLRAQDETVVLRAVSADAPGYLRGRIFTHYRGGRWTAPRYGDALPYSEPGGRFAYKLFERRQDSPRTSSASPLPEMTVYPATYLHDALLYAPGSALRFELIAEGLTDNPDGLLMPREWDQRAGYSMLVPTDASAAFPHPTISPPPPKRYTQVPKDLIADLAAVNDSVHSDTPSGSLTLVAVQRLVDHFRQNFAYSLGVKMDSQSDPILQFLTRHHKGHCELFAAATVLLLRQRGIPARYVTGFVCEEQHPAGSHWLARLKHAHAWAEAYIPETKRWVLVETTPETGIPNGLQTTGLLAAIKDRVQLWWTDLFAKLKRGYIAEVIVQALVGASRFLWFCVADPLRGLLLALVALVAIRRFRQRRRDRRNADSLLPPERQRLQAILFDIQQYIRRALGSDRPPEVTLREWAGQLTSRATPESHTVIRELFSEYEQLRYRQAPPPETVVRAFADKARRQLRYIRPEKDVLPLTDSEKPEERNAPTGSQ
ncbi:MAG: transglutaminase domain-containing protein, partial [Lentisphaerae bacterium]|nr:transglutaminase domain-containing protein [Lentisphaerota bacterium]MBT7055011.1 transglutaminase domain-containing protein [Lentisphaerota bacterium]MBT7843257.1 transglutaminase domain-containing protein [Lentisphaerota bacterium]